MSAGMTREQTAWEIATDFLCALAPHEPVAAQALRVNAGHGLPDLSPEWSEARYALEGETLARLRGIDRERLSKAELSLVFAMEERLESDRRLFETGFLPRLIAPLASPVHTVREAFDGETIDAATGEQIVQRLEAVPATIEQLRRRLLWAAEQGEVGRFTGGGVVAKLQLDVLAAQIDGWIDPAGMDFFKSIPVAAEVSAGVRERAHRAGDAATEAFASLAEFLRGTLREHAPDQDAAGEAVYLATSRSFLGADADLDELYAYGWAELDRLVGRAQEVSTRILSAAGATVPANNDSAAAVIQRAAELLDANTGGTLADENEIRVWLETRMDDTIRALNGTVFEIPEAISDVVCDVTRAASGVVYYTPAAPDGSQPSRVVWTIPRDVTAISTWQEVTAFHHEGVPGHHLEHTINRANTELHPWQRALCEVHGYAEGWAHYSEQLSEELGLLRGDDELLGMLLGQIWRAVRVVADIGLHTGRPVPATAFTEAGEWTRDIAESLLVGLALTTPQTARFEVDRYLAWPGQALAFKVGQRLWNGLRECAEAGNATGDPFDLKAFHQDALSWGPMGLQPLADLLARDSGEIRDGAAEIAATIEALYRDLGNRVGFDLRLDSNVTVWESADPRLLHGIDELNELRGPAVASEDRTGPVPVAVPAELVCDAWGDTGIARYVLVVQAHEGGPVIEHVRVTDVLRREKGDWRIVHHHAQDLGAPAQPAAANAADTTSKGV